MIIAIINGLQGEVAVGKSQQIVVFGNPA